MPHSILMVRIAHEANSFEPGGRNGDVLIQLNLADSGNIRTKDSCVNSLVRAFVKKIRAGCIGIFLISRQNDPATLNFLLSHRASSRHSPHDLLAQNLLSVRMVLFYQRGNFYALLFAVLISSFSVPVLAHECETSCSEACVALMQDYQAIVQHHQEYCNGQGSDCASRLSKLRPYWSASDLKQACSGAAANCVVELATQRPYWTATDLNQACAKDQNNCAGQLASQRPYWTAADLAQACSSAGEDCVLSLAKARPYWTASDLNTSCRNDYTNCAGRLAEIRPYWTAGDLATACQGVSGDCVVGLAKDKPYWSAADLNSACH